MPELPDVQIYKQYFDATSLRRRIVQAKVLAPTMLLTISAVTFESRLKGRAFEATRRHGKYLFAALNRGGWLVLHFGMTGSLVAYGGESNRLRHLRLRIDFAGGRHLAMVDQRKLGKIGLIDKVEPFIKRRGLGPDPMQPGFDSAAFRRALQGRRGSLKSMFLNQRVLAGIGNIYADEILFRARVHPAARVHHLRDRTMTRLYRAMRSVLRTAVAARADEEQFPRTFMLRHRFRGGRCPRCGRQWSTLQLAGRTTYYCRFDQRRRR